MILSNINNPLELGKIFQRNISKSLENIIFVFLINQSMFDIS